MIYGIQFSVLLKTIERHSEKEIIKIIKQALLDGEQVQDVFIFDFTFDEDEE